MNISRILIVPAIAILSLASCDTSGGAGVKKTKDVDEVVVEVDSLTFYNKSIVAAPSDPMLYHKRAKLNLNNGRLDEAMNDLNRSIKLDSLVSETHVTKGEVYLRQGNLTMAKISYNNAVSIDPKNVDAQLKYSLYHLGLKDYDKAISFADNALKLDVNNAEIYFVKGRIFFAGRDTTKAISSFQTATEMNPNYIEAFQMLGLIYGERNDDLALNYYQSALSIDPNNTSALYGKGYFEMNQNKKKKAMASFKKITVVDPADPVPYYNIGYIHMFSNEIDSAIVYYSIAIDRSSEYYQAFYNRGSCYEELKNYSLAEQDYKDAIKIKPDYSLAIEGMNRIKN